MNNGPLQGVRITEFTSAWAGPYATCLLAFLGAEVIKVESMQHVDHSRLISFSTSKSFSGPDQSSVYNNLNLNKKGVTINLAKPEGIELSKELLRKSDAAIENMRPGVIERLGLGYEAVKEVKPDIVYLSSSACGQEGPDSQHIGYAPNFAASGGICYVTGYEDWGPSNFMGSIDLKSAVTAAFALLMGLCHHQRTGTGQYIDMSSQESIAILNSDLLLDFVMNQREPVKKHNLDDIMAPHNCYRCKGEDKWISIAVTNDEEWLSFCDIMDMPELKDDDRFIDAYTRRSNREELDTIINGWTKKRDYYDLMTVLQEAKVAAAPSLNSQGLFDNPHLKERKAFMKVDHPVIGEDWVVSPPWKFSETPAQIERHSPLMGEHNDEVFQQLLGMSIEKINKLKEEQVIY